MKAAQGSGWCGGDIVNKINGESYIMVLLTHWITEHLTGCEKRSVTGIGGQYVDWNIVLGAPVWPCQMPSKGVP